MPNAFAALLVVLFVSRHGVLAQPTAPTQSQTQTKTQTLSASMTPSLTRTVSITSTLSPTQSQASTPTQSQASTPTPTQSQSASATSTPPLLRSQTPSSSATPPTSFSGTPTQSQTSTASASAAAPVLYTLAISAENDGSVASRGFVASLADSLPARSLALSLSPCPAQQGVKIDCNVTATSGAKRSATGPVVNVALSPRSQVNLGCTPAVAAAAATFYPVPVSLAVSTAFRSTAGIGTLVCTASDAGSGSQLAAASASLLIKETLWALFDDVIAVTGQGIISSYLLGPVSGTDALLAAAGESTCATLGSDCSRSLNDALSDPAVVLNATMQTWGDANLTLLAAYAMSSRAGVSAGDFASPGAAFSLTLTGSTHIVLRSLVPAFTIDTKAGRHELMLRSCIYRSHTGFHVCRFFSEESNAASCFHRMMGGGCTSLRLTGPSLTVQETAATRS
jgi:hypothetical protein